MPIPTPFHPRTSELCTSMFYKDWAGFYTVCSYDTHHDREYQAIRHGAALIDVTPLHKYEVKGKDAGAMLARMMVKDVRKLKDMQVTYLCWCDDEGKVVDDGTVTKINDEHYRVTAAEPTFHWFQRLGRGYKDLQLEDSTETMAALSVQGPNSRELLKQICDAKLDSLKFFRATDTKFDGFTGTISRTGYTGDLGYEVWVENKDAVALYDQILAVGKHYGAEPCGLDAMDVSRIEAGFIMNGVDYISANHALIDSRKSSPYELGLGWTVKLNRDPFIGQEALIEEKEKGSKRQTVCLEIDYVELEKKFAEHELPPEICSKAWRSPVPVFDLTQKQIGYANCGAWSPTLKKNLALALVDSDLSAVGTELRIEQTVEYRRRFVKATVVPSPMFNPERKRSTPDA